MKSFAIRITLEPTNLYSVSLIVSQTHSALHTHARTHKFPIFGLLFVRRGLHPFYICFASNGIQSDDKSQISFSVSSVAKDFLPAFLLLLLLLPFCLIGINFSKAVRLIRFNSHSAHRWWAKTTRKYNQSKLSTARTVSSLSQRKVQSIGRTNRTKLRSEPCVMEEKSHSTLHWVTWKFACWMRKNWEKILKFNQMPSVNSAHNYRERFLFFGVYYYFCPLSVAMAKVIANGTI